MARDNVIIRGIKDKYNASLKILNEKYPEISFRPRSEISDGTKANDINIYIDGKVVIILTADDRFPNGRLMTDTLLPSDKKDALLLEGRGDDPDPDTLFTRYRFRPKWTPVKYIRSFATYNDCLFEIEKIICLYLDRPLPEQDMGINVATSPKAMSADGYIVICPRCSEKFQRASRCTNCGQLISYPDNDKNK